MRRLLAPILLILTLTLAACEAVPTARQGTRPAPGADAGPAAQAGVVRRPEANHCAAELGASGSRFSSLPDANYGAGCATSDAVRLDAVGGDRGEFAVSNLGAVACPLATRFAGWARYGVDRAARQILGSPLVRIETMGSYACRNIAGSTRISAHSRAEAIDVAAFVLADGRRISVLRDWSGDTAERRFLRVVQDSACKRFGTVLGPDYNAAHRDHFHLELGEGRSFCR